MARVKEYLSHLHTVAVLRTLLGSAILAFGLYNIHDVADITEGGALGLTLLLDHWLGISPAISGAIINILCYLTGWRLLGSRFVVYSCLATGGFCAAYALCECFPPLFPAIADYPALAAILGAAFVGVGVGLCVREGGAPTGDDALAMSFSHLLRIPIQWVYLVTDFVVLGASLTYLPLPRILWSVLTVVLSGQIIGLFSKKPTAH